MNNWINAPNAIVNMAQVCRIEFRYTDVQQGDEVDGFVLYFANGNTATVFYDEVGFTEIADALDDQGFVLTLREAK
jgi:hypothetical protein